MSKSLTSVEWEQAKQVYITTQCSLKKIATDFKTTYHRVQRRYKKEEWQKLRIEHFNKEKVTIADDAIERSIKSARTKDVEHQEIAKTAVQIARACLSIVAKQLQKAKDNPEQLDALAVQRSINALKEAVNLERVTHNLPTGVLKSDVTSGGEPIQGSLNSLLDSKEVLELAKELGIDVKYFKGLAVRVANDAGGEGQSQD